jgi:hypothetical protein
VLLGQVASVSRFRPVPPCSLSRVGSPTSAMSSPVSCGHPVAYGESVGAGLCLASCFFPVFTGKAASPHPHRLAYDGLSNGDDLAGVYIEHALPIVQQQLLNAGIRLAKIIDENF